METNNVAIPVEQEVTHTHTRHFNDWLWQVEKLEIQYVEKLVLPLPL